MMIICGLGSATAKGKPGSTITFTGPTMLLTVLSSFATALSRRILLELEEYSSPTIFQLRWKLNTVAFVHLLFDASVLRQADLHGNNHCIHVQMIHRLNVIEHKSKSMHSAISRACELHFSDLIVRERTTSHRR